MLPDSEQTKLSEQNLERYKYLVDSGAISAAKIINLISNELQKDSTLLVLKDSIIVVLKSEIVIYQSIDTLNESVKSVLIQENKGLKRKVVLYKVGIGVALVAILVKGLFL